MNSSQNLGVTNNKLTTSPEGKKNDIISEEQNTEVNKQENEEIIARFE